MSDRAPVNYYGSKNSTRSFNNALFEEVPLFDASTTPQQREVTETLSEIYSIIVALEQVEKAYLKDGISSDDYTVSVNKLIAQYKTYLANNSDVQAVFGDLQQFRQRWNINASNAIARLERGMPVTVEHGIQGSSGDNPASSSGTQFNAKAVAEATGNFITVMDALKLRLKAKDQLHPLMSELLLSINRVGPQDFEKRSKLVEWIVQINKMKANESLGDDEARELLFDLDSAYKAFYTLLG